MKTNKIKAVIFDLDGIIIESEPWQKEAFDLTMQPYNIHFNDKQFAELIGIRSIDNFRKIKKKYDIPISAKELTAIKNKSYARILKQKITPRGHFNDLFHYLRERYILSLASSSIREDVFNSIRLLNIEKYFEVIVTGDDVNAGKPDPEIFLKTALQLKIAPESCAVIEDSQNGINAAKKAGMLSIAVPTKHTANHDFKNADHLFKDLSEIKQVL